MHTIYMKNNNYIYSRTSVYNVHYHIVWCVKYRRKILSTDVETYLKDVLCSIGKETGFNVAMAEAGEQDHVHVFVDAPPKMSISFIVKHLKGTSAIRLFKRFPHLRNNLWKNTLWNGSYFVETIGSTSEDNVRRYIERQAKCAR